MKFVLRYALKLEAIALFLAVLEHKNLPINR